MHFAGGVDLGYFASEAGVAGSIPAAGRMCRRSSMDRAPKRTWSLVPRQNVCHNRRISSVMKMGVTSLPGDAGIDPCRRAAA